MLNDALKQKQAEIETLEKEVKHMSNKICKQNCQIQNLQNQLDKKHEEVKVLKEQKHCDEDSNTEMVVLVN